MQKDLYICFVDHDKRFDTVRHEELVDILKETAVGGKTIIKDDSEFVLEWK